MSFIQAHPSGLLSCAVLTVCLTATGVMANNIQVSNAAFQVHSDTEARIQFNLSWENSWKGSGVANWDAAWVFLKYKQSNGAWRHVQLTFSGHTAPPGSAVDNGLLDPFTPFNASTNPVMGVFIRRDTDGTGTFTANGVQLRWDIGTQGIIAVNDIVEVRVFAIETVYVNQGPFWLGDGSSYQTFQAGSTTEPYEVTSEAALSINSSAGLWSSWAGSMETSTLPAAFPKGYRAFYAMKYELSQQQYADMLNTLTRVQQAARVATNIAPGITSVTDRYVMRGSATVQMRSVIRCDATIDAQGPVHFYCDANQNGLGGEPDDGQWIAGTQLGSLDVAAYLDWSGLRLMTELEFEKLCRGPLTPVPGEYAWGNALVEADDDYVLHNVNTAQEGVGSGFRTTSGNASLTYGLSTVVGVVRVGCFAADPLNNGRMTSGAGYYGAMELSGNVAEPVVSVRRSDGRAYTGQHGNGTLSSTGTYDVAQWPSPDPSVSGFGRRGEDQQATVSTRPASYGAAGRSNRTGGRGVRTAP